MSAQELKGIEYFRKHPLEWIHQSLGIQKFSSDQAHLLEEIPRAIAERKPIVVPSGHTQGKDFIASCIAPWFALNYGPSKVILTAPTDRQVKDIMWAEIETRMRNAPVKLPGRMITCKIEYEPNWYIIGFTTKEYGDSVGKAQGFHAPHVCVIVSEAQAVQDKIFEQLDSLLSSGLGLMIMIGNPLCSTGKFARAIKDTTHNIVINFNCLNSPNYRYKQNLIPGMASHEWIEEKRREWDPEGKGDHPFWRARILGQLPEGSIDSVFSADLVDKMVKAQPRQTVRKIVTSSDPAGFGDDECVIEANCSGRLMKRDILAMSSGPDVCSRVLQMVRFSKSNQITMDVGGLGGPIADFIRAILPQGVYLQGINSAGAPSDESYQNLRAEMWFYAKQQAEEGRESIPDDDYLKQELCETKYFINQRGKIQIEPKDDIKERIGRSPNRADSWILNVWGRKTSAVVTAHDAWSTPGEDREVMSMVGSGMAA